MKVPSRPSIPAKFPALRLRTQTPYRLSHSQRKPRPMKPCQFTTVPTGSGGGIVRAKAGEALNSLIAVHYLRPCLAMSGQGGMGSQCKSPKEALT